MNIPVYSLEGKKIGEETLADELLKAPVRGDILHEYVTAHLANKRYGTASTKTRAEVSGSGRKPWRQKGTGRARVGEVRNPIWRKGGVVFGPHPRSYEVRLPRKVKQMALCEALKDKFMHEKVILLEQPQAAATPKTKPFVNFLKAVGYAGEGVLLVTGKASENRAVIVKSVRNIETLRLGYADHLNPYEILRSSALVLLKETYADIVRLLGDRNV